MHFEQWYGDWYGGSWDAILFWAQFLGLLVVVPCAIIGAVILLRKDRSLSTWMFSLGAVVAVSTAFLGDFAYIWITDGILGMSYDDPLWQVHLRTDATLTSIKLIAAIVASFGFVPFAARCYCSSKCKEKPNKPAHPTAGKPQV